MSLEKYQEKINELNKREESMSYKEFKEGIINYMYQKGLENELKDDWYNSKRGLNNKDMVIKSELSSQIRNVLYDEYNSYLGDRTPKGKIEYLEQRAEEFGLHLDVYAQIEEFKTEEIEKDWERKLKSDDEGYYITNFDNAYHYHCSGTLFVDAKTIEEDVNEDLNKLKTFDETGVEEVYSFKLIKLEDVKKMIEEKIKDNKESDYFEEKNKLFKEMFKEFIEEKIEKIKNGEDLMLSNYQNKEDFIDTLKELGYKNAYLLEHTKKIYSLSEKYFEEKNIDSPERYGKEILNTNKKEKNNEIEKDFER